ncbi:MAG: serine protease [Vicinamibacterales bacterium]
MTRAWLLALQATILIATLGGQTPGVLRIKVSVADAADHAVPLARHALLISDNPATSTPRRVVTGTDGTVDVRLPPGNYTIESDEPALVGGKRYNWIETVDVPASGDLVLELTAASAEVSEESGTPTGTVSGAATPAPGGGPSSSGTSDLPVREQAAVLLTRWQDSIVAVWTPRARTSGFIADARGLVVTSYRALNGASTMAVQVTPTRKVEARLAGRDATKDVAILWVDAAAVAGLTPLAPECHAAATPPLARYDEVISLGAPMHGPKTAEDGAITRADAREATAADLRLAAGSVGGPVFDRTGRLAGLTSSFAEERGRPRRDSRVVPLVDVCAVLERATAEVAAASVNDRPDPVTRPVEPAQPFPAAALDTAVKNRSEAAPPRMASTDFDITFLTPLSIEVARRRGARDRSGPDPRELDPTDFDDWSDYFDETPPVLTVRVTPRLAEGFWTRIARGAAYTQGMALPPIRRFRPGFARMQAYCGDREVTPIQPLVLEQRVTESDAVREGLYVFDAQALGPHCASVRLGLSSEKEPQKVDVRTVPPAIIDRIWQDFATYREEPNGAARQ